MKRKGFMVLLGIIPIALILFYAATLLRESRGSLSFTDHMDKVAATVDGEEILFKDLIFYVLFEEQKIEEQALIYNPDSPKDYWNAHTNGVFVQIEARDAIMGMAIHDHIMLKYATEAHVVLTTDEKNALEEARTKFWGSLFEGQLERLPLSYEDGNRIMKEIALIEAYEHDLASSEPDVSFAGLAWDGYDFENIKKQHKVKVNEKLWHRMSVGEISLKHDKVNYINGLSDEELEELKNRELRERK